MLELIAGVLAYLACGMVIARVIMKPQDECRDCELDAACYVLIWPFIVAFVGLYGSLELLGRVVMWRKY